MSDTYTLQAFRLPAGSPWLGPHQGPGWYVVVLRSYVGQLPSGDRYPVGIVPVAGPAFLPDGQPLVQAVEWADRVGWGVVRGHGFVTGDVLAWTVRRRGHCATCRCPASSVDHGKGDDDA